MRDPALLFAVFVASYLGFALLALSQQRHWRSFAGIRMCPAWLISSFRLAGSGAIAAGLWPALLRDGAGFGSLLWVCAISVAAVAVTLTLTSRAKRES